MACASGSVGCGPGVSSALEVGTTVGLGGGSVVMVVVSGMVVVGGGASTCGPPGNGGGGCGGGPGSCITVTVCVGGDSLPPHATAKGAVAMRTPTATCIPRVATFRAIVSVTIWTPEQPLHCHGRTVSAGISRVPHYSISGLVEVPGLRERPFSGGLGRPGSTALNSAESAASETSCVLITCSSSVNPMCESFRDSRQ
jgi:hypothetical protein